MVFLACDSGVERDPDASQYSVDGMTGFAFCMSLDHSIKHRVTQFKVYELSGRVCNKHAYHQLPITHKFITHRFCSVAGGGQWGGAEGVGCAEGPCIWQHMPCPRCRPHPLSVEAQGWRPSHTSIVSETAASHFCGFGLHSEYQARLCKRSFS